MRWNSRTLLFVVCGIGALMLLNYILQGSTAERESLEEERVSLREERESLQKERESLAEDRAELKSLYKKMKGNPAPSTPSSPKDANYKRLLEEDVKKYETVITATPNLKPHIERDRKVLDSVPRWIEDSVYKNSLFQYGFPEYVYDKIDKPQGDEPTYSDVLAYIGTKYFPKKKNYLEIGVSVGKTIYQIVNAYEDSACYAYELENINPTLEAFFTDKKVIEKWPTMSGSNRKEDSSLAVYKFDKTGSTLNYLNADVFDKNSWERLKGTKFDIVFSDGLHSPDAVNHELDMMINLDLLNDDFVIYYDDLESMKDSFFRTFFKLQETKFPDLGRNNIAFVKVRGSFGIHEWQHLNGIITSLDISKIIKEDLTSN